MTTTFRPELLGHRRNGHPIWAIQGGSEPPVEPPPAPPVPTPPPADRGFPADTPVAEMTVEQQAAYWKHHARQHEGRVKAYNDLGLTPEQIKKLQTDAETARQAAMTEQDRAVAAARDEGRQAAVAEASATSVAAMLQMGLMARGRTEQEAEAQLKYVNTAAFIADGKFDLTAINAYADSVAGPAKGPAAGNGPDFGAGNRGPTPGVTPGAAGLAEAQRRYGTPVAATQ